MRLSQVPAALAAGVIDLRRAEVFARELLPLDDELAVRAEAMVMPRAPELATGQLAAALQRRTKRAEHDARVEAWAEPGRGTAALAGRDLPTAEVIAADQRLTAAARWLKANGAHGTMDWLRSRAYLAFINGYTLHDILASLTANQPSAHDQPRRPRHRPRLRPRRARPTRHRPPRLARHHHHHPHRNRDLPAPPPDSPIPALPQPAAHHQDPQPPVRLPRLPPTATTTTPSPTTKAARPANATCTQYASVNYTASPVVPGDASSLSRTWHTSGQGSCGGLVNDQ